MAIWLWCRHRHVSQLQRLTSQTTTIKATIKRRLQYKHYVYCLNIRPELVRNAAKFLSENTLYKEYIAFNDILDNIDESELSEKPPNNLENNDQMNSNMNRENSEKEMFTSHSSTIYDSEVNHTTQQEHGNIESQ